MKPVLIDCDPGIDDAVALIAALKSPELDVRAITATTGNVRADDSAENIFKILDLMGAADIPVAQGPLEPLMRPHAIDPFSHGVDGLADKGLAKSHRKLDRRFAADLIVDIAAQEGDKLNIIATAPLTNLALAIIKVPDIVKQIEHVYFIGGSYGFNDYAQMYGTGTTPLSEWNVLVDPEAARIVFRSGVPLTAMGVDVWAQPEMNLTDADLKQLSESARDEAEVTRHFIQFVEGRGYQRYSALIDTLAVIAAIDPSILQTYHVGVDVETNSSLTLGMTVVERRVYHAWKDLPKIHAAYSADFDRYRQSVVQLIVA